MSAPGRMMGTMIGVILIITAGALGTGVAVIRSLTRATWCWCGHTKVAHRDLADECTLCPCDRFSAPMIRRGFHAI